MLSKKKKKHKVITLGSLSAEFPVPTEIRMRGRGVKGDKDNLPCMTG